MRSTSNLLKIKVMMDGHVWVMWAYRRN